VTEKFSVVVKIDTIGKCDGNFGAVGKIGATGKCDKNFAWWENLARQESVTEIST
jgi:hypothetical protein